MAGNMELDFAAFKKHANEYAATIPPIDKSVDSLQVLVENRKNGWSGTASDAFGRFANELLPKIRQVNVDLGQVSATLEAGEKKVSTAEGQSMEGFTTLNTNYL
ncbi:WXG100 family type VII secretion target [Nocardia sp. NPDC003979]